MLMLAEPQKPDGRIIDGLLSQIVCPFSTFRSCHEPWAILAVRAAGSPATPFAAEVVRASTA